MTASFVYFYHHLEFFNSSLLRKKSRNIVQLLAALGLSPFPSFPTMFTSNPYFFTSMKCWFANLPENLSASLKWNPSWWIIEINFLMETASILPKVFFFSLFLKNSIVSLQLDRKQYFYCQEKLLWTFFEPLCFPFEYSRGFRETFPKN